MRKPELEFHEPLADWQKTNGVTLGKIFAPGMYACRPPGMRHGPYLSGGGCRMLVIARPKSDPST